MNINRKVKQTVQMMYKMQTLKKLNKWCRIAPGGAFRRTFE